jgi:N6-L-threonylcarbamoyladenine synthase
MILAIESSCDESALALFDPARGVLTDAIHTQAAMHALYGGVVPDIAAREHLSKFPDLLKLLPSDFDPAKLDLIAVTRGPGLAGCLALGIAFAKSLALAWNKPLLGTNHLRGHLWSPFIPLHAANPAAFRTELAKLLPHLGVVVSGGNTLLVALEADGTVTILAQTVDDAAGEAFDKGAKLLGLPYPGGALLEKAALAGDVSKYDFPRGIPEKADPRLSFSGLKTSLRYRMEKMSDETLREELPHLCAGYQAAIIDQLIAKTLGALKSRKFASLGLSGGVANNKTLRAAFADLAKRRRLPLLVAEPRHTGDNAAMIAFAAWADPSMPPAQSGAWNLNFEPALTIDRI